MNDLRINGESSNQSIIQSIAATPSLAFAADRLTITIASDSLIVHLIVGPQQCACGYCWIQCAGQFALTSTSRISVPIGECASNGRAAIDRQAEALEKKV